MFTEGEFERILYIFAAEIAGTGVDFVELLDLGLSLSYRFVIAEHLNLPSPKNNAVIQRQL